MKKPVIITVIALAIIASFFAIYLNSGPEINKDLIGVWKPKNTNNQEIETDQLLNIDLKDRGKLLIGDREGTWDQKEDLIYFYDTDGKDIGNGTVLKDGNGLILVVTLKVDKEDGIQYIYTK